MFYANAAKMAVEANREFHQRRRITRAIRYDRRIEDPREIELAEWKERDAYLDAKFTRYRMTDTPEAIDFENCEDYTGPRVFAPVTQFVDDADIDY